MNAARGPATHLGAISDLHYAMNSALAFERRFKDTGHINNISQAIFHYEIAAPLFPPADDILPHIFNKLGDLYSTCFKHTGKLQDIDHAISDHQRAVASTPPGHLTLQIHSSASAVYMQITFNALVISRILTMPYPTLKMVLNILLLAMLTSVIGPKTLELHIQFASKAQATSRTLIVLYPTSRVL